MPKHCIGVSLVALALGGCGDSDNGGGGGDSARAVVQSYLEAQSIGDGKRICALYSSNYRGVIENDPDNESGESCEQQAKAAAAQSTGTAAEIDSVEKSGDRAVATVSCEDPTASDCSLPLVREDGQWRVDGGLSPND